MARRTAVACLLTDIVRAGLLLLGLLIGLMRAAPALAQTLPSTQAHPAMQVPVIALHAGQSEIGLSDRVLLRVDPEGLAQPQDILARGGFMSPGPADLQPGYSRATYWLRADLVNRSPEIQRRALQVPPTRLEQVSLFTRIDGGPWRLSSAGTSVPFAARELPWRVSTFALTLAPGQRMELMLRVASRSAILLQPRLWEPSALVARQQRILLLDGLLLGMMLLVTALAATLALVLRDRAYAYTALCMASFVLYDQSIRGTSFMLLWPQATDWAVRALGTFGALGPLMQLMAIGHMLDLPRRQPRVHLVLSLLALASLLAMTLMLWGDYRQGTQIAVVLNNMLLAGTIAAVWRARRQPLAGAWLAMTLAGLVGVTPRHVELLGLHAPDLLSDYALPVTGLLGIMVVLGNLLHKLHQERRRYEQRLEQAVKMRTQDLTEARERAERSDQVKGRLLGYLGHDLRAPLASMVQVARQLRPDTDFETGRQAIEHSSLLALEMIDEMHHFARDPQSEARLEIVPAPLYLHALLHDIVNQSQALARAGGNRLTLDLAGHLPEVVELDARRLRQVLVNLLANAAKFTRAGHIRLGARIDMSGQLELTVSDNGPGLTQTDLTRVFEPFVRGQSTEDRPGIGLGLSIVQQMVEAMGGAVGVSSQTGQGASFRVQLPWTPAAEEDVMWPPAKPWLARCIGLDRIVLLLDPCASVREALRERLALAEFQCIEAQDLLEAKALLNAQPVSLLVAEPEITPYMLDWIEGCRRLQPALAVLLCSRRLSPVERRWPGLLKPAAESEWWAAVEQAMAPPPPLPSRRGGAQLTSPSA
ncbi:sensor histidine kinase [Sphaerotilus natans]|uniref:sensor histidine kinase n=1 Tax=Sphaerotilus natans TaxID=34103 RepID=UPI00138DFD86|nr:ATP-binding protein [Sphaerotilus natans]